MSNLVIFHGSSGVSRIEQRVRHCRIPDIEDGHESGDSHEDTDSNHGKNYLKTGFEPHPRGRDTLGVRRLLTSTIERGLRWMK